MGEQSLLLMVSDRMDANKKDGRNEHALLRCSSTTREAIGNTISTLNLLGDKSSVSLNIHQAYIDDLKLLKINDKLPIADVSKVAFVTTEIMRKLIGNTDLKVVPIKCGVPKLKPTLLGADPEFLLFNNDGNIVRAVNVIQKAGKIGSDGAMIEVRPDPSTDPKDVVENIRSIFCNKHLTEPVSKYKWVAGIYHKDVVRDYPVGGHIHIGNPENIDKISQDAKKSLFAVLNKILDELLALPMIKLDGAELGKARRSECKMSVVGTSGYGFYGEWRPCQGHLEHRTLSGLWLAHPKLSEYVLGTAKAIADAAYSYVVARGFSVEAFKHPDINHHDHKYLYGSGFDSWADIPLAKELDCISGSGLMANLLNNSRASSITSKFLKDWYVKLQRIETYNEYASYIDGLYEVLCLTPRSLSKLDLDIKKNWVDGNAFII